MSQLTMIQDRPSTFFAPARLGASKTEAVKRMLPIIRNYVEDGAQAELGNSAEVRRDLARLVADHLDAAVANGYSRKATFTEVLSTIKGKLYREVYEELDRKGGPRDEKLEELTRMLQRLAVAPNNLKQSLETRSEIANKPLKREDKKNVMRAWHKNQKEMRAKRLEKIRNGEL
jgi:hypothetical protein